MSDYVKLILNLACVLINLAAFVVVARQSRPNTFRLVLYAGLAAWCATDAFLLITKGHF